MSNSNFNSVFADRLKYFLYINKMTQADLAKKLGVGTTSVSNWVNSIKSPRMSKIDAMCEIFHCKRSDLMEPRSASAAELELSQEEKELVSRYRLADDGLRRSVRILLGMPEGKNNTFSEEEYLKDA